MGPNFHPDSMANLQDLYRYFCLFSSQVTSLSALYGYDYNSPEKPRCHKCETAWNTEQTEEKQKQENIDARPRATLKVLKGIFKYSIWKVQQPEG